MNDRNLEERLSAYLDGELSPPERDEVRRLLEKSPEARRELEELTALSETVQSLPRQSAPDETASAVLKRIERDSLFGAGPSPAAEGQPAARRSDGLSGLKGRGRGRRSWGVAVAGLTAAAAVVAVLVSLPHQPLADRSERTDPESAVAMRESSTPRRPAEAANASSGQSGSERRAAASDQTTDAEAGEPQAQPSPAVADQLKPPRPGSPPDRQRGRGEGPASPESADGRGAVGRSSSPSGRFEKPSHNVDWSDVEIGDVVPYFKTSGDRVAVVEVTVVDIRRGWGAMQVLLARNSVPRLDQADIDERDGEEQRATSIARSHRPLALYVETTERQLASTLAALQKDASFVDLRLRRPVAAGQLVTLRESRSRRGLSRGGRGEADRLSVEPPSPSAEAAPQNRAAGSKPAGRDRDTAPEPRPRSEAPQPGSSAPADAARRAEETTVVRKRQPAVAPNWPDRPESSLADRREAPPTSRQDRPSRMQRRNSPGRSFQQIVELPGSPLAGDTPAQRESVPSSAEAAGPETDGGEHEQSSAPVRIVFVFREAQGAGTPGSQEQ